MDTVTDINKTKILLQSFIASSDETNTVPLKVVSVKKGSIIIESPSDSDTLIRLKGTFDIAVDSTISVNLTTGEITILKSAPAKKSSKKQPIMSGALDRSFIVR